MRSLLLISLMMASTAFAQMVEVKDNNESAPQGRDKAQEYFKERQGSRSDDSPRRTFGGGDDGAAPRYMAIHLGTFFSSQAYKWGDGSGDDPGKFNMGVTYRIGEWVNSMDLALRIEYTSYVLKVLDETNTEFYDEDARKLSFSLLFSFPDANSRFPLYFGAGIGPGIMMKKLDDESAVVLDYSLVAGARFLNVIDNIGFMVETGLKNHISLLSDGQFNGVFINVGSVFAF